MRGLAVAAVHGLLCRRLLTAIGRGGGASGVSRRRERLRVMLSGCGRLVALGPTGIASLLRLALLLSASLHHVVSPLRRGRRARNAVGALLRTRRGGRWRGCLLLLLLLQVLASHGHDVLLLLCLVE